MYKNRASNIWGIRGPRINTKGQVMDVRGKIIDGLYAAGEVVGGIAGAY